jgi:Tol biopolymer transport system component
MPSIKSITGILVFSAILLGCRKDPPVYPDECGYFETNPNIGSINYISPDTLSLFANYSPANSNEMCFYQYVESLNTSSIFIHNRQSGLNSFVCNANPFYNLCFGKTGWIIFDIGNDVWKVKSNGDSLLQVTSGGTYLYPEFNPDGTMFACSKVTGSQYQTLIVDLSGNVIDTIENVRWNKGAWSKTNPQLAAIFTNTIQLVNTNTHQFEVLSFAEPHGSISDDIKDACFSADGEKLFFINGFGVYSYDIQSQIKTRIASSCKKRDFVTLDIDSSGQILLLSSVNQELLNYQTNTIYIDYKTYTMRTNGTNQTVFPLR